MPRFLVLSMVLAVSGLAGCQYGPSTAAPPPAMMSTGAPCGYRAVDSRDMPEGRIQGAGRGALLAVTAAPA